MENYSISYMEQKSKEKDSETTEITQNSQYEVDLPGYLDDFLNHSKKKIFVIGNNENIINSSPIPNPQSPIPNPHISKII